MPSRTVNVSTLAVVSKAGQHHRANSPIARAPGAGFDSLCAARNRTEYGLGPCPFLLVFFRPKLARALSRAIPFLALLP